MPFFRLLKKLDTNECSSLTPGDLIAKEKKITPADKHAFDRALKMTTALKERSGFILLHNHYTR